MRFIIPAIVLIFASAANASTITIDFEELSPGVGIGPNGASFTSQGFDFFAGYTINSGIVSTGSDEYAAAFAAEYPWGPSGAVIEMSRADGQAFALYSADYLSESVRIKTSSGDWYEFTDMGGAGSGLWLDILQVNFESAGYGSVRLDDVIVGPAAVPVPAAVWLFASGLGLLGFVRRRRSFSCAR